MAEQLSSTRVFDGEQRIYRHASRTCGCDMRFAVFLPPAAAAQPVPVLTWLSGLTCTEENFITKAGAQRIAAALGIALVVPDTSPRGDAVPDRDSYDLGQGAGFYVDATEAPWNVNYRMYSYVTDELQELMGGLLPVDLSRQGIFGHSMGGHGALTLHLRRPDLYRSVSAFAPIVAPSQVPWGQAALGLYLGADPAAWLEHDATALVTERPSAAAILIDQGEADSFLNQQLRPELFEAACAAAGQRLTLNLRAGYDHSYYFIATFIENHLRHHAAALL